MEPVGPGGALFDSTIYPYCDSGFNYAKDILSGKIVSCIYVKGACQRFFDDVERAKDKHCKYYFDPDNAKSIREYARSGDQ